jgi:hypothetical protein
MFSKENLDEENPWGGILAAQQCVQLELPTTLQCKLHKHNLSLDVIPFQIPNLEPIGHSFDKKTKMSLIATIQKKRYTNNKS